MSTLLGRSMVTARERTHGDFTLVAAVAAEMRDLLRAQPRWADMLVGQREALDMIALKMARIVCGDPGHLDHWDDIAGYAELGADAGAREGDEGGDEV